MKVKRNGWLSKISIFLCVCFISLNVHTYTAIAADSAIKILGNNTEVNTEGKTVVTGLQIINLEYPKVGQMLDSEATIMTSQKITWNIPVIWVDEENNISTVCAIRKKYIPVFAYYVPDNIVVTGADGSSDYSIKIPDFISSLYGNEELISVTSAISKITYITTPAFLIANAGNSAWNSGTASKISAIISRDELISRKSFEGFLKDIIEEERQNSASAETASAQIIDNIPQDSAGGENSTENSAGDGNTSEAGGDASDVSDSVDASLVKLYCTPEIIEKFGESSLAEFLNIIINYVEPMAVNTLIDSFPSYNEAQKNELLGKKIGFYVYDSRFNKSENDNVLAYVSAKYNNENDNNSFEYFLAINTESLYKETQEGSGEYVINSDESETLYNTLTHEMMHAFMDDYNRTGMMGNTVKADYDNSFPVWFIEGTATAVDNAYTFRQDIFQEMRTNRSGAEPEIESEYTEELLMDYYNSYSDEGNGSPSIDSTNKYYEKENNIASAYVSGYLAVLYLAAMAVENGKVDGVQYVKYQDTTTNSSYFDSEALRKGVDSILYLLHNGKSLDEVIYDISENAYADTKAFQDAFLTENDNSVSFCLELLNYFNDVSNYLKEELNDENALANGSILLPFDTAKETSFEIDLNGELPEKLAYIITDSENTYVASTVDDESTYKGGGLHETADSENADTILSDDIAAVAQKGEEYTQNEAYAENEENSLENAASSGSSTDEEKKEIAGNDTEDATENASEEASIENISENASLEGSNKEATSVESSKEELADVASTGNSVEELADASSTGNSAEELADASSTENSAEELADASSTGNSAEELADVASTGNSAEELAVTSSTGNSVEELTDAASTEKTSEEKSTVSEAIASDDDNLPNAASSGNSDEDSTNPENVQTNEVSDRMLFTGVAEDNSATDGDESDDEEEYQIIDVDIKHDDDQENEGYCSDGNAL